MSLKLENKNLIDEAVKNRPDYRAPKSAEELEEFKNEYPDVMAVVETVAHLAKRIKDKSSRRET